MKANGTDQHQVTEIGGRMNVPRLRSSRVPGLHSVEVLRTRAPATSSRSGSNGTELVQLIERPQPTTSTLPIHPMASQIAFISYRDGHRTGLAHERGWQR